MKRLCRKSRGCSYKKDRGTCFLQRRRTVRGEDQGPGLVCAADGKYGNGRYPGHHGCGGQRRAERLHTAAGRGVRAHRAHHDAGRAAGHTAVHPDAGHHHPGGHDAVGLPGLTTWTRASRCRHSIPHFRAGNGPGKDIRTGHAVSNVKEIIEGAKRSASKSPLSLSSLSSARLSLRVRPRRLAFSWPWGCRWTVSPAAACRRTHTR